MKTDIADVEADGNASLKKLENGVLEVGLKKGESVLLLPRGQRPEAPVIEPIAAQADRTNTFGLP